jgi:hypothetical protein
MFLVSEQNLNPPIDTFDRLKIVKNEGELRKLQAPKVEGVKNSKNKTSNATKPISNHPKISLNFALSPLKFQDDL